MVPISHPAVDVAVNGHAAKNSSHARPGSGSDQQNASVLWERGSVIAPAEFVTVVAPVGCGGGNVIDRVDVGLESFQSRLHAADAVTVVDGRCASGDAETAELEKCVPSASFVARVVEVTADAKWDEDLNPREFLMRLRAGDKLHLLAGMAHLEFIPEPASFFRDRLSLLRPVRQKARSSPDG